MHRGGEVIDKSKILKRLLLQRLPMKVGRRSCIGGWGISSQPNMIPPDRVSTEGKRQLRVGQAREGVDVGATIERVAKRAHGEEAVAHADTREGQAVADPPPNLGVALPIIEFVPPTLEVLVHLDQPTIFEGTTAVIVLVPLDGGEEEEELLDYSSGDDLAFRHSPNIDSLAEDLKILSSLPTQMSFVATPRGVNSDIVGEWSSLAGAACVGALSSP
ncbi:uncharacterized protein A4U43_C08F13520 [Asparagus officinalis]|nr:uncharacterized protein A4U43_C08F13520 [Asparagus officinalis]